MRRAAAIGLGASLALGCGGDHRRTALSGQERIIARVDGQDVPAGLFEAYLRDNLNVTDPPTGDGRRDPTDVSRANAISDEVKSRLLDRFLLEQALHARARAAGIAVDEEALDRFSRAVGLGPLQTLHEGAPFTEREYLRRYLEQCWMVKRYLDTRVLGGISASEEEAREWYGAHASRFSIPDRYRLRLIRVDSLAEAKDLLKEIGKDGTGFLAKAQALTEEVEGEGAQGKSLGLWRADELPEPFAAAVAALPRGAVSDPIQDPDGGFNLLWVEDRIEGGTTPFEAVKGEILQRVTREKRDRALEAFLAEARAASRIEIDILNLDFPYVEKNAAAAASPTPAAAPGEPASPPPPGGAT